MRESQGPDEHEPVLGLPADRFEGDVAVVLVAVTEQGAHQQFVTRDPERSEHSLDIGLAGGTTWGVELQRQVAVADDQVTTASLHDDATRSHDALQPVEALDRAATVKPLQQVATLYGCALGLQYRGQGVSLPGWGAWECGAGGNLTRCLGNLPR